MRGATGGGRVRSSSHAETPPLIFSIDIAFLLWYTFYMMQATKTLPYALDIYDTRVVSWGDAAHLHREWAASLEDAESSRKDWLNTRAGQAGHYSIRISRGSEAIT